MHEQPFSRRACLQTQILSEIEMYFLILNWFQAAIVFLAFCPISNPVLFPHYCIDEVQLIVTAHRGSEVVLRGIEQSNKLELKINYQVKIYLQSYITFICLGTFHWYLSNLVCGYHFHLKCPSNYQCSSL